MEEVKRPRIDRCSKSSDAERHRLCAAIEIDKEVKDGSFVHCSRDAGATGAIEMNPDERGLLDAIHDCIAALETQLRLLRESPNPEQDVLIRELEKILEEIRASIS